MNWFTSPEMKVGLMVVVVTGMIGAMSLKVAQGPGILSGAHKHTFVVDNAGGLVKNSAVKMAGIKVGTIDDIQLENGKAKVTILVDKNVPITAGTKIELRTQGILGDRHVELIPGSDNEPKLASGTAIVNTTEGNGLDDVMKQVSKIAKNLGQLTDTLNKAAHGKGDDSTPIGRIILNIEKVSRDLAEVTGENKEKINEIMDRVKNLTTKLDTYIDGESLHHLQASLKNVDEITDKINKGQGTIGRLINDEQTIDEINTAVQNVNNMIGGISRWETSVDFHSEFMANTNLTKSFLSLRLQPGLDRYYEVQLVDDPQGVVRTTVTDSSVGGGPSTELTEVKTYKNQLKFTALFAKNFYDFTLKGGLIQSAGGVGMDYYLLNRDLRLSFEAFNFANLNIRAFARYNFFKGLYITGGIDTVLNNDRQFSSFIGAGLFITNDDLKILATRLTL